MGKITVKHYLNKHLKPRIEGNNELYPLYLQVIVNTKNYKMKSRFPYNDGYLMESDLTNEFVKSSNNSEAAQIIKIVTHLQEYDNLQLISADYISQQSKNLWELLNNNFHFLFEKESDCLQYQYPNLFTNQKFIDIKEVLIFTESEIETKFTEDYQYCKTGMEAIEQSLYSLDKESSKINEITVFDFLNGDGKNIILQVIKNHFYYGNEDEPIKVLGEINKLITME